MKKIICFIFVIVLMLALCACDSMDYKKAMSAYDNGDYEDACKMFEALGDYENSADMVNACNYEIAWELMDDAEYAEAATLFEELGDYEDSADLVNVCNYEIAQELMDDAEYAEAVTLFEELGDYKDSADLVNVCNYEIAQELMDDAEYAKAAKLFEALGDYRDSAEKLEKCHVGEIDTLLQGEWTGSQSTIVMDYIFNNGRFTVSMTVGSNSIANEGSYRIDIDKKEVYVCYDYIISATGKQPNTEETMLFTYTYDGQELIVSDTLTGVLTKK